MQKQYKLTKDTYENLKNELEYLKTVREKEVADQIKEARSFGDLSENSEYDEAKNEQGKLFFRRVELENILAGAVIIDENELPTDAICHGAKITIRLNGDDEEMEYILVGSQEADPTMAKISDESPLGKALLGKKIGDVVTVEAPVGKLQYTILNISR